MISHRRNLCPDALVALTAWAVAVGDIVVVERLPFGAVRQTLADVSRE